MQKARKPRTFFPNDIKLQLLKQCVEHNPFDEPNDTEAWNTIVKNFAKSDKKTLKAILKRMMEAYRHDQMQFK